MKISLPGTRLWSVIRMLRPGERSTSSEQAAAAGRHAGPRGPAGGDSGLRRAHHAVERPRDAPAERIEPRPGDSREEGAALLRHVGPGGEPAQRGGREQVDQRLAVAGHVVELADELVLVFRNSSSGTEFLVPRFARPHPVAQLPGIVQPARRNEIFERIREQHLELQPLAPRLGGEMVERSEEAVLVRARAPLSSSAGYMIAVRT